MKEELLYDHMTKAQPAAHLSPSMDFASIAQGAGCASARISAVKYIEKATKRLLEQLGGRKPGLMKLVIINKPTRPETVAMVGTKSFENKHKQITQRHKKNKPRASCEVCVLRPPLTAYIH